MTITFVGHDVQTTTPGRINLPSGTSAGTVLVAKLGNYQNGATIATPPTGWTLRSYRVHPSGGDDNITTWIYTYVCTGSDPSFWDFVTNFGDSPGECLAYDGVDPDDPWDSGFSAADGYDDTPTGTGVTPEKDGSMLLWLWWGDGPALTGDLSGWNVRTTGTVGGNGNPTYGTWGTYDQLQTTAVATGDVAATIGGNDDWVVVLGILKPIAAGGLVDVDAGTDTPVVSDDMIRGLQISRPSGRITRFFID